LGRPVDGLAFVSKESFRRNQQPMGIQFLNQALAADPNNAAALAVQREYVDQDVNQKQQNQQQQQGTTSKQQQQSTVSTVAAGQGQGQGHVGKSPEELYEMASQHFSAREYEDCADVFEISCALSNQNLGPSCANAVYCRSMIVDWGWNGTLFDADMKRIADITTSEARQYRQTATGDNADDNYDDPIALQHNPFAWQRATSVHPHMMLGYPVNSVLKRFVAESVAFMDEKMARAGQAQTTTENGSLNLPSLPSDLPYPVFSEPWKRESMTMSTSDYKIRVGFVGSGFNSKAVLYLSQDMFRFFDKTQFEIHVFSFGPPDNPLFIQHGMRGVDWRKRVQSNVNQFHDMQKYKNDHIQAARYIREQKIHILIEWDGYARQGERAQGLFTLRPAPIQMLHQEYLGTSGALYVDYLFTDNVTSPMKQTQHLFTEKLIYMPNHFFSKGHAMQKEVAKPTFQYQPRIANNNNNNEYKMGTGTPQQNRCLAGNNNNTDVSFVFCNWNKLLKNNPETVRSWIQILRKVPNSILCLLENPKSGTEYLRKFVHEAAGTIDETKMNSADATTLFPWEAFIPGDGEALNDRIHFLEWEKNPFDHQRRNLDFCNLMLDSWPYNGHTVAQDALYAGVPIVTRSDGLDMSSRVTTSANIVLGLPHLNANEGGTQQYEQIAIEMATNHTLYTQTRIKLIETALQRNPMHPYWDVPRYVKNFEQGLRTAWDRFLNTDTNHNDDAVAVKDHILIQETTLAQAGTYDDEIAKHPQEGPFPIL